MDEKKKKQKHCRDGVGDDDNLEDSSASIFTILLFIIFSINIENKNDIKIEYKTKT